MIKWRILVDMETGLQMQQKTVCSWPAEWPSTVQAWIFCMELFSYLVSTHITTTTTTTTTDSTIIIIKCIFI
jgi:hypothetical protein